MSSFIHCAGHTHSPKLNSELFHACVRCNYLHANGQPAPSLKDWIGGICPIVNKEIGKC